MSRRLLILIVGLTLSPTQTAHAQWTFGAYAGCVHTLPSQLTIRKPAEGIDLTFRGVPFEGRSFAPPLYYGYRAGKQVCCGGVTLEAELIHAKVYAQLSGLTGEGRSGAQEVRGVPVAQHLRYLAMSHGLNFLLANAVVRRRLSGSPFVLLGRAGVGAVVPHGETETPDGRIEKYQLGRLGSQAAAGLEIRLWRWASLSSEYKYTYARPRIDITGGDAAVTTRSHHFTVGVTLGAKR